MFRHVSQGGQKLGNNVSATKIALGKHEMFLNLIGNISASREANCVSATMFPRVDKHRNTWQINVSATILPSLSMVLVSGSATAMTSQLTCPCTF
jgi:hypothetical protein